MENNLNHSFPAKLLLFGEYTIIKGSQALALPFPSYRGHWQKKQKKQIPSGQSLTGILEYLEKLADSGTLISELDLQSFRQQIDEGLYFSSTIPSGYGMGSSGALCAAIFSRFGATNAALPLPELRQQLAQIEHFFHGSSSGIDPLVCYLDDAIHAYSSTEINQTKIPSPSADSPVIFVINTGIERETEPLVQLFLGKCDSPVFVEQTLQPLSQLNDQAIQYFLEGNWLKLAPVIAQISQKQFEQFREMIPEDFQKMWQLSFHTDAYKLKLCGAGGGGFILGFTNDWQLCEEAFAEYAIEMVWG